MTLDEFTEFLDSHGIHYKVAQNSIVMRDCPHCNSNKEKVWFFKERRSEEMPFFGQCMKCEAKMSSSSYLISVGIDKGAVNRLHGRALGLGGEFKLDVLPALNLFGDHDDAETEDEQLKPIEPVDVSAFVSIEAMPDHPASKYAISRGWTPIQKKDILIDYFSSAVVFVVRHNGESVGFQRRFLNPTDPDRKTLSSLGFQKNRFTIEYPNDGDILVCEGPFTALSAWHFGYHAVCTFGSGVGDEQIKKIAEIAESTGKSVAVAFDLDSAGRKGYAKVRSRLFERGVSVYRVKAEEGNDLNDSWKAGKGVVVLDDYADSSIPLLDLPFKEFA